jgi:hypothetical protein
MINSSINSKKLNLCKFSVSQLKWLGSIPLLPRVRAKKIHASSLVLLIETAEMI